LKASALAILLFPVLLRAEDLSSRYLLQDFNNGKAVGKNVFDAGPLSDRDEIQGSKTKVLVSAVSDGAEGQAIQIDVDMPPNAALGYEYGGVYFSQDRFDASAFNALHFQMRLPQGKGFFFPLKVAVTDDDPVYGKTDYEAQLWFYLKNNTQWQDVFIPFSRLLDKRDNSLRGRRITSVAFSLAKSGKYQFQLDTLEFVSTHGDGMMKAMDNFRPELKAIVRVMDDQSDQQFSAQTTNEEYLNLQVSPRIGYAEARVSLAGGNDNGGLGLVNFSDLTQTSPTLLQPPFFAYPKGETGMTLIFDGWGKNSLHLKSVSLGNNQIDYSDTTYFQTWFPAWVAPSNSSLPLLGSARIQGDFYDVFGALADFQGCDATTFGAKLDLGGLEMILSKTSLAARAYAQGNPSTPVYGDEEATLQYTLGRLKDPIRFRLWGALFQSTEHYLPSNTLGQDPYDVPDPATRIIMNQPLSTPIVTNDKGLTADLYFNEFLLPGNQVTLQADWIGPALEPLFRDYYEGGVDVIYYNVADASFSATQALWIFTLNGAASIGTEPSNYFQRRTQQTIGISWHDVFHTGLNLSYSNIYLQEVNDLNDQVSTFYDQRDRVSWAFAASLPLGPWGQLSWKQRADVDNLYSNADGAYMQSQGVTDAVQTHIEAKFNIGPQTRLFLTYSYETPFSYYTYYDPMLLENYSGVKLESTF
jgi:hypothetical protein